MPGLEVTLVLCTADGELLGAAAPFTVENEWWRDVEDVVSGARTALGVEVRVLRILEVPDDTDFPGGGHVAYLAEVDRRPEHVPLGTWPDNPLLAHPNRLAYAEPGGHQRDLDWAADDAGRSRHRGDRIAGAGAHLEPLQHLAAHDQRRAWSG